MYVVYIQNEDGTLEQISTFENVEFARNLARGQSISSDKPVLCMTRDETGTLRRCCAFQRGLQIGPSLCGL